MSVNTVRCIEGPVMEGTDPTFAARVQVIRGNDWGDVQQADVASITYASFEVDADGAATQVSSGTLTISAVIFDALQTGDIWPFEDGFNFRPSIQRENFPDGDVSYRVECLFTLTGGTRFYVVFRGPVLEIYGS